MAKKQFDDLDWDRSLDYDLDDPFAPVSSNKKRGVIGRVASNLAKGAGDALKTPSTLKSMAGNMLPKGYGDAFTFADEIHRQGEELHNIAMKEMGPSLPTMRRLTQRHLPKVKRFLPKGVSDQLDEFSKQTQGYSGQSQEQVDELSIKKGMADVFGVQMEADARQNAENKIERALHHAQSMKMSRGQLRSLDLMQQGVMRLVNYQDDITNKFQRRSLELQTRHYFVARDSLRLQHETARRVNAQLEALVTNSAMPDIAKQDLAHTATQTFRNRLLGSAQNSATKYASKYVENMFKRMQDNVRSAAGGANDVFGNMDAGEDGPPMLEMLAQMLGQQAMTGGSKIFGGRVQDFIEKKAPGVAQFGRRLRRGAREMPRKINKYANSATTRQGGAGIVEDGLKSVLGQYKLDTTIGTNSIGGMDKPASFDRLTRLSIVEVIPGLLSRIEHNTARVLDPKADRQIWNMDRRGFSNIRTASDDMVKRIADPGRLASAKQEVNQFIDDLIGKNPITAETRRGLFRQLMLDSGNLIPFDPKRYMTVGSDTPELTAKSKQELSNILNSVGKLANGKVDEKWMDDREEHYAKLDIGEIAPISAAGVYRSGGYRELLKDKGLVERDGFNDKFNLGSFMNLIENADYNDIKVKETSVQDRAKDFLGKKIKSGLDLFDKKGGKAILSEAKLKAGAYRDAITGQPITKWDDIKGAIKDISDNDVVIDISKLSGGLVDGKGKTYTFNLRSAATGATNWATDKLNNARETVTSKANEVKDIVNKKGEVVLAGWKISAGKYRDAVTKTTIEKVEDICGPVIDENDNTVVTASDIVSILSEKGGRTLEDAAHRMRLRNSSMLNQAGASLKPVMSSLETKAANNIYDQPEAGSLADSGEMVRLNTEQVELLKVIAQILATQGSNGADWQDPKFRRGFLDSLAIGGISRTWTGAKNLVKGSWWWTKKVGSGVTGTLGLGARSVGAIASGGAHRIGNMVRGIKDIYVKGKRRPVMIAQRIKLGQYQDVNSGKKIVRWTDVTGPVIDLKSGETILDQDDFDAGIYVKGPAGLVRLATKSIMGLGSSIVSFAGLAASLPFRIGSMALKGVSTAVKWLANKQVDVYVRGESSPRLMASKMKTGRYYNAGPKKIGKVVTTYADIYGEIKELAPGEHKAQKDDKTVLFEHEIHDPGICGRWGLSLKTPLSRLVGALGGAAVGVVKGAAALFGGAVKGVGRLMGGMLGMGGGAIGAAIGAPFKFLGALLNPFEKHGAKQVEWLEKIFGVLDNRLPGKKVRKGSWKEQFAERDAETKEKTEKAEKARHESKWGVGSLLSYFKNKASGLFGGGDDEEEEDEDDGDTTVIAGGGGGGKDGESKEAKRKRRMAAKKKAGRRKGKLGMAFRAKDAAAAGFGKLRGKLPKGGFLGSPAKMAMTAGGVMGGSYLLDKTLGEDSTARNAVGTAATVGGTALTASWISGLLGGPTIGAALGGTAMGGAVASGLATAGTAIAGGAAAVLGAPIWIPLAIAAGVGAAVYFAHRQYKFGKLTPVRRFRYLQYGVAPGSVSNTKQIFKLEELLLDHVGEKNGGLEVLGKSNSGGKEITMDAVYDLMDMKDGWFSNKKNQRQMFNIWYAKRFKPIFLTWVKSLRDIDSQMPLLEADEKLEGEKQTKLLQKAWGVSRELYSISAGPFGDEYAVTDFGLIEDAYNLALKEAGKSPEQRSKDKWRSRAKTAMTFLMPGTSIVGSLFGNKKAEENAKKEGAEISAKKTEASTGISMLGTTGAIKNTNGIDSMLSSPLARLGKVTPLAAIRYRAYGLSSLDIDRVRAVAALETYVFKHVSIGSEGNVFYPKDAEQTYNLVCGLFGLTASNTSDRNRWSAWFGRRFLPVCSAYIKAVKAVAPSADLQTPERTLKADKLMEIGQQMLNARDRDGNSIWHFTMSPWNAQEKLNSNSSAISASLLTLKTAAENKLMAEEKISGADAAVKQNKGALAGILDSMKSGAGKASDWLLGDKNNRNFLGKTVDSLGAAATTAWNGAQSGFNHVADAFHSASTGAANLVNGMRFPGLNSDALWKKVAPLIASGESMGGNYDAQNGVAGNITPGLSTMTIGQVHGLASQIGKSDNVGGKYGPKTGAAGKYQFIPKTLLAAMKKAGLKLTDAFSPENQEKMGRGLFDARVAAGLASGPVGILDQLAMEWASLPSPSKGGASWYAGDAAGNRAHGGKKRLEELFAAVTGSSSAHAGTLPPTTTTTTANGATGGVGVAEAKAKADFSGVSSSVSTSPDKPKVGTPAVGSRVAVKATTTGTNSLSSGGGYAAMAAGAGYSASPSIPAAPSIDSTASLNAAASSSAKADADRVAAADRERQVRNQQTRAIEAQTMRQSQSDQAVMSRVGEILQKSLEVQHQIAKNTADSVTVLRQLLRNGGDTNTADAGNAPASAEKPKPVYSGRPVQSKPEKVPVSVRFNTPNG